MFTEFAKLPDNIEDFKAMDLMDLTKAENTCTMFLCALHLFVKNRDEGVEAFNLLKGPSPLSAHEISFLADRVRDKAYLPLIYFVGATPDNNYTPNVPYRLEFHDDQRPQDVEEGYLRYYFKTTGADAARAIKLRRKGDSWYLWEYPGMVMDVRKPHDEDPWA